MTTRSSGVLMHVSSLFGTDRIGGFGKEARDFIDFLADAGFSWWQVLPFCMTDECNSPYKSFSAFSGNPYFVDLRQIAAEGLLTAEELESDREKTPYACEFEQLHESRLDLLRLAASRCGDADRAKVDAFLRDNPHVAGFCSFMAHRKANGDLPWYEWSPETRDMTDEDEYFAWGFIEQRFAAQWQEIHAYANKKGIRILGDMPIYVAYDSADVWADQRQFQLDGNGAPSSVAGCPPDYFAKDGQLWGNPLYDWDYMKKDGFTWWKSRLSHMLSLFDGVRIDHFRGFESYWSIPADAETAKEGHWEPGPGLALIDALKETAADVEAETGRKVMIVAEDLGDSTPALARFVKDSGFPNMKVLQFAFDGDPDNVHLPYNYDHNCVAYTGTHDNNTLLGYIWEADEATRRRTLDYCGFTEKDWNCPDSYKSVIRTLFASPADLCVMPIQDLLMYGADTRMNIPGKPEGNWRYRITRAQLDSIDKDWFRTLNRLYGRSK